MENKFLETISNDQLAELPTLQFGGKIVVVDSDEGLSDACNHLLQCKIVGFDTETRPKFTKGTPNKVGLLQLSAPDVCYLFRLCSMRLDKSIIKILESKDIIKVGVDVNNDMAALKKLRHFTFNNLIDLQDIASQWGITDKSLRKLAGIVLNGRVSKAQRLSNWEAHVLTPPQRMYAATDAWVCIEIYNRLLSTNKSK